MDRVVLAYSGDLESTVAIHWLIHQRNMRVIAFVANVGQAQYLEPLGEIALEIGADSVHILDVREQFADEFILPVLRAGAVYQSGYLLGAALARYLIAGHLVRIAQDERCYHLAHAGTGKGNDQVRFEAAVAAIGPGLTVLAPAREWPMRTHGQLLDYIEKHRLPHAELPPKSLRVDRNLWGGSLMCDELGDPWVQPAEEIYQITTPPERAPARSVQIEIAFEAGRPTALDGQPMPLTGLIEKLTETGGQHGIGREDLVEDRISGLKTRQIYEAPAATILSQAHCALESVTLCRRMLSIKDEMARRYAQIIYDGFWFSDMRESLDAFFDRSQRFVTGATRVKLLKGSCVVTGRQSPHSLYDESQASSGEPDTFDYSAAQGFARMWSLTSRLEAARRPSPDRRPANGGSP